MSSSSFVMCGAYASALKEQLSKCINDPETLNMTLKYCPYNYKKVYVSASKPCVFRQPLCPSSIPDLSIPIISRTKDKRYQVKMSLKLPLNANLFLAALPSAPSQSLADKEISNQNKLQHIPRAIQSLIRSILRPILGIINECPTPLPCKLCHGYSNWKCLIKANYENCNSVNVISKQSAHGGRANSLNRRAQS